MKSFKNILVYVDSFATYPQTAFHKAIQVATGNHGAITLIDVIEEVPWFMNAITHKAQDILDSTEGIRRDKLEEMAEEARNYDIPVKTLLVHGKPFVEIIRAALRDNHDLVMKTSRQPIDEGSSGGLYGQTAIRLIRKCPCPVWLVAANAPEAYKNVVVSIDPAPENESQNKLSKKLMDTAISITCPETGVLTTLHAWSLYAETLFSSRMTPQELREHIESVEEQVLEMVETFMIPFKDFLPEGKIELVRGEPGFAIPEYAHKSGADLLVMGTSGRSGLPQFFSGHIAEMVANEVNCSLLVIKPDEFVSPIHV